MIPVSLDPRNMIPACLICDLREVVLTLVDPPEGPAPMTHAASINGIDNNSGTLSFLYS
jgi:hypothetical protein